LKRAHFEALHPICPLCATRRNKPSALKIGFALRQDDDGVLDGALQCTDQNCLCEFPIIDGIPILVPDPRTYISENIFDITRRSDLSESVEGLLGECCGPGSALDATRQHLSNYAWDHYAEFDPSESQINPGPGSVARTLKQCLSLLKPEPSGPMIDMGCSVGRSTFELSNNCNELVLGVDLNFSMLRLAAQVLQQATVKYARRRSGLLYDLRQFSVTFPNAAKVDFWACDATAVPFAPGTFATAVSLNVLDCTHSPLDLLRSMHRVLIPQGQLLLTSPYDWSGTATLPEAWIGGHSPRSLGEGKSEPNLRALLTPGGHAASIDGLRLTGELDNIPWHVRLHDRSVATYRLHAVAAVAEALPQSDPVVSNE